MPERELKNAQLIAISGKQYAGKDFLADLLLTRLPDFQKIPLAAAIKLAYAQKTGLSLTEIEQNKAQYRPDLIAMGDWGRAQDPDYWLKQVLELPGKKLIPDVRLKREYDLLKTHGAYLIRLNTDRAIRAQRGKLVSENDPTECQLDTITDWDAELTNNGSLEELKHQCDALL